MDKKIVISKEQEAIITAPIMEKTIVMASAASGKTTCVTERIRTILKCGIDPHEIVAITFTNNAAAEMRERIGDDFRDGMFIGTIHSYANMLLMSKGYDTSQIRIDEEFDKLFEMIAIHPEVLREVKFLCCDESQDLNSEQFDFIFTLIQPKACLIVGDIRQSIYGFRGAEPKMLLRLMRDEDYVVRELTQNYRNATNIIKFSNSIVDRMKDVNLGIVKPMRPIKGSIKKVTSAELVKIIRNEPVWSKWSVLCRTNSKVTQIMQILQRNNIPCITFRQAQGNLEDLKKNMDSDKVKVLTIHSSKGLEFDNVIVCDMYTHGKEEDLRLSYVAVTRARDELYICAK